MTVEDGPLFDNTSSSSEFQEFEEEYITPVVESRWSRTRRSLSFQLSRLRPKYLRSGFLLRKIVVLVAILVVLLVVGIFTIKHIRQKIRRANESDYPDFSHEKKEKLGRKNLASSLDFPFELGCRVPDIDGPRANASFVMLARNSEVEDVVSSMKSMERHFNQWYNYPWVFLNDVEFTDVFKKTVQQYTNAKIEFGRVPQEHWDFPPEVDREELHEWIESQGDRTVMYGNMESYHKMCRFYSGHFYDHPLVQKRKWYWRVEPAVQFFCDLTYDPFLEMEKHNKKYGFTIALNELYYTVPSLFMETKAFIKQNNIKVASAWDFVAKKFGTVSGANADLYKSWSSSVDLANQVEKNVNLKRIMNKKGKTDADFETFSEFQHMTDIFEKATEKPPLYLDRVGDEEYNLCHFWTNFEISRTDLFLSKTYQDYFKHLEKSGGFYKERWGDAPVHSLAVSMMLPREQLHYFRDIGYKHSTLGHCPNNAPDKQLPYKANGFKHEEKKPWYYIFHKNGPDKPQRNGVGCRCECPSRLREMENRNSVCLKRYAHVVSDNYKSKKPFEIDKIEKFYTRKADKALKNGKKVELDDKREKA